MRWSAVPPDGTQRQPRLSRRACGRVGRVDRIPDPTDAVLGRDQRALYRRVAGHVVGLLAHNGGECTDRHRGKLAGDARKAAGELMDSRVDLPRDRGDRDQAEEDDEREQREIPVPATANEIRTTLRVDGPLRMTG